jgi:transglutaminase-like putative cysteine protease
MGRGLLIPPWAIIPIPDGPAGTRETLKQMRDLVRLGRLDPRLRDLALLIVRDVPSKFWLGELAAIFNFVKKNIRYRLDTRDVEVLQSAPVTLALGYGDCDDRSILTATLCEHCGHTCTLVALGFEPEENYSHVLVMADGGNETGPIPLDTTEPHPMGWFPPGVRWSLTAEI